MRERWIEPVPVFAVVGGPPQRVDRLQLIQGCLEGYVAGTRERGEKSFAHPYAIMIKVLEKAKIN